VRVSLVDVPHHDPTHVLIAMNRGTRARSTSTGSPGLG
jgi:hypothetical protein